jgi:hypothetical protein
VVRIPQPVQEERQILSDGQLIREDLTIPENSVQIRMSSAIHQHHEPKVANVNHALIGVDLKCLPAEEEVAAADPVLHEVVAAVVVVHVTDNFLIYENEKQGTPVWSSIFPCLFSGHFGRFAE